MEEEEGEEEHLRLKHNYTGGQHLRKKTINKKKMSTDLEKMTLYKVKKRQCAIITNRKNPIILCFLKEK